MLLIGDPGVGKSALLDGAAEIAAMPASGWCAQGAGMVSGSQDLTSFSCHCRVASADSTSISKKRSVSRSVAARQARAAH